MAVDIPAIREVVERVCTRKDVLDACMRRDLGAVIALLCAHGITQGQISVLTGIPQGRLSEYKTHKRMPSATSTFEAFADGLGMPPAARSGLGLAPQTAGSGPPDSVGRRAADIDAASLSDVRPLLTTLSRASVIPVLSALRGIHRSYIEADRLMGSMCLTGPVRLQMPVVERACEVTRGADRAEMLGFACQFMEFGGWLFQDAGDLTCAMHWTDRALDYALELGDQRITAYTLMRKAMIATESGNPAPYCSPNYVAMEAGASWLLLDHPRSAIPILEKGHSEWLDNSQMRDYALCVSRLAAAYAAAGELEQACAAAEEARALAQGLGSRRVAGQIDLVHRRLGRWRQDPALASLRRSLKVLVDSFIPEREAS